MGAPPPAPPPPPPPRPLRRSSPWPADSARARLPLRGAEPALKRSEAGVSAAMGASSPPPPPRPRPLRPPPRVVEEGMPPTRFPLRRRELLAGAHAKSAAAGTSTAPLEASTPTLPRPPLGLGALHPEASASGVCLCHKRGRPPPASTEEETEEDHHPPPARRRLMFPADGASSSAAPASTAPSTSSQVHVNLDWSGPDVHRFNSRIGPTTPPASTAPSTSSYSQVHVNLDWSGPDVHRFNSRTGPTTPPASTAPSTSSYSQRHGNMDWNGPGLHRFNGMENLLLSVGDLNRFLSRREELCILQNAHHFVRSGIIYDASFDPRRRDYVFLVVSRTTFLEIAVRSGVQEGVKWPGYKEAYYELSEERRISTLKFNEDTFLWRHEVSGSRLLRRRVSLDDDKGPFDDETKVFYILQYHKLPRTKKSTKASILAERARRGHF